MPFCHQSLPWFNFFALFWLRPGLYIVDNLFSFFPFGILFVLPEIVCEIQASNTFFFICTVRNLHINMLSINISGKTFLSMSALWQRPSQKDPKNIYSLWHQDNIHKWLISPIYLFHVNPLTEFKITKNCVDSIPWGCGKIYKEKACCPQNFRLEEHRKAVVHIEIETLGIADHIWKKKGNDQH